MASRFASPQPGSRTSTAAGISLSDVGVESIPDHNSQSEYDALADLFLGEDGAASLAIHAALIEAEPKAADFPPDRPARVPQPVVSAAASPVAVRGPQVDSVAAAAALEPAPTAPELELLILGHLPVLGNAWVPQYVHQLAHLDASPVALIRTHGGTTTVDLAWNDAATGVLPADRLAAAQSSLAAALALAVEFAPRVVLRVDEHEESDLADVPQLNAITLLSGADDAALIASYRTLKGLSGAARTHTTSGGMTPGASPHLRVVIMGSEEDRARAAAAKLTKTVRTFLALDIESKLGPRRMGPGRTTSIFRGDAGFSPAELAAAIVSASQPEQASKAATPAGVAAVAKVGGSPSPTVEAARQVHAKQPGGTAAEVHATVAGPASKPLCTHLADAKLSLHPIGIHCPYAPDVEFAADESGALHILTSARTRAGDVIADRLSQLMGASGWAFDHAAILSRILASETGRSGNVAPAERGTHLHLFTDDPRPVRRHLDGGVRVHLLSSVTVGGETIWLCSDLN